MRKVSSSSHLIVGIAVLVAVAVAMIAAMSRSGVTVSSTEGAVQPRIVSFVPTATETAFACGLGPYVVGRSRFCDYPAEVSRIEAAGDLVSLSEETVSRLRPTHALLYSPDAQGQAPFLRALGVQIIECAASDVQSVIDIADRLGSAFSAYTNGFAIGPWRERMEALVDVPLARDAVPALVVVSRPETQWSEVFAAGGDAFYEQVLRAAGYSNVLSSAHGYPVLDPGRIRSLSPEVVFDLRPGSEPNPSEIEFWAGPLPDARVAVLRDTAAVRPGPRLADLPEMFRAAAR